MNTIHTTPRRTGNAAWSQRGICLSLLAVLWLSAAPAIADGPPDFSIGADRFPGADAVILNWQQTWTLDEDGAVRRRDHKWIKLFNSRPVRTQADPRIDFVDGRDEVIIHIAQAHLPNGRVLPVPDYGFNIAAPSDVSGFPAYADWQQRIVSFSGIEPGVVLELDYEVVTPAGVLPWIEGDLRLRQQYPIVNRSVAVTVPETLSLHHHVAGSEKADYASTRSGGGVTHRWTWSDLAAAPDEPQSPPWRERCGRLRFSTCSTATDWVATALDRMRRSARASDSITAFAKEAVKDEADPRRRVRAIAKKLRDTFDYVTSIKTMFSCRSADAALRGHYGNPFEAGALLAAAVRSLDVNATLHVAIHATQWQATDGIAPTAWDFAGAVVEVDLPDGTAFVHPRLGLLDNPGTWGRKRLLSIDQDGTLRETYLFACGEREPNDLTISGKITIDSDGGAAGELRIRLTGVFFDPMKLEEADDQKAFIKKIAGRVLSGFDLTDHSVSALSKTEFRATASVASKDGLDRPGKAYLLQLGDGPAFLDDVPLPLGRSHRQSAVRIAGRVRERIDLTIEAPEKWHVAFAPARLSTIEGDWGRAGQEVSVDGRTLRFQRTIDIDQETISSEAFDSLRQAVNDLRATRSLTAGFAPMD